MNDATLPDGWMRRRLLDIVVMPKGQVDPRAVPYRDQVLIAPDHVEPGTGRLLARKTAAEQGAISGKYPVRPGDVVLSKIRPALRKVVKSDLVGLCSADMYPLRPRSEILSSYLHAILLGEEFSTFAVSVSGRSGIPKINRKELSEFFVLVPPVGEQRRILRVLDALGDTIRLVEKDIEKWASFKEGVLRSLLREDFAHGVPVELGDCLIGIEAGRSPDLPDQPAAPGQWGLLKVSAVRYGRFDGGENKVIVDPGLIDASAEIRDGDLLMTRANTPQLVGLVCFVKNPPERLLLCDKTLRLIPDVKKLMPQYVEHVLASPILRSQIEASGTGSSGSMKNISQGEIRSLRFSLPGIARQRYVVERINAVDLAMDACRKELSKLRNLNRGLMNDMLTVRL